MLDINNVIILVTVTLEEFLLQKCDSGDSGNEEPNTEMDFYVKKEEGSFHMNLTSRTERFYASPPKADRLADRVNTLSVARDYKLENVPEGLVEALPPEGMQLFVDYVLHFSILFYCKVI